MKCLKSILSGFLVTDCHKSAAGRIWEFVSRFTWQLPQTVCAFCYAAFLLIAGRVQKVRSAYGCTFVFCQYEDEGFGAVTLGSFVFVGMACSIDENDFAPERSNLLMHEYGHYRQGQVYGLSFLLVIGVESLVSAFVSKPLPAPYSFLDTHSQCWYEIDANRRGADYIKKYFGLVWSNRSFPLSKLSV